jgi:hypothetical protein
LPTIPPRFGNFPLRVEEEPEVEICLSEITFSEQLRGLNDDLFDFHRKALHRELALIPQATGYSRNVSTTLACPIFFSATWQSNRQRESHCVSAPD